VAKDSAHNTDHKTNDAELCQGAVRARGATSTSGAPHQRLVPPESYSSSKKSLELQKFAGDDAIEGAEDFYHREHDGRVQHARHHLVADSSPQ
jgi:hypothetical protein